MNTTPKRPQHVAFSHEPPVFDGARMMVDFIVSIDAQSIVCSVSAEALEDHFGAVSALESELL
jgi:hypothetical protein